MKQVSVYTTAGTVGGKISLPGEIFAHPPTGGLNERLLAQAYRVYQIRAHTGFHKTKTRGEVMGTTAKMHRQKGTGRARHGARKAPLFRGGGIAHGPKGTKRLVSLPKKLARRALLMALSDRLTNNKLFIIDVGKINAKTKAVASLFKKLKISGKVLVLHGKEDNFLLSARNMPGITLIPANGVNAFLVIRHPTLVLTREGVELLKKRFLEKIEDKEAKK